MADPDITQLLHQWREGVPQAQEDLARAVYAELHRLAHHQMRRERRSHLLQTTALVHEAYLRLVQLELPWRDRAHFFKVAARQMRRVLVDSARRRLAAKRDGGEAVPLESITLATAPTFEVLALDQALESLARQDPRKAQVVELRFFGGMTIEETADVMGISHATVERDLKMAKAWLRRSMNESPTDPSQ